MRCVSALGLAAAFGLLPWPAAAAWQAVFERPAVGWLAPGDSLTVMLEGTLPEGLSQRVRLELDAIDVTDRVGWNGQTLVYVPAEPLAPGMHELRLVEFTAQGEIIELGAWMFEVRQSENLREWSAATALQASWQARIADANITPRPAANIAQLSASVDAAASNALGSASLRAAVVHDGSLAADNTQLYELLISGNSESGELRFQLGQQALADNSLVRQDFMRRGLSVEGAAGRAWLTGYALRTDTQTAPGDPFGLARSGQLTRGVMLRFSPFRDDPQRLVMRAEWLRAEGREQGVAEFGENQDARGEAWSLAADAYHFDGRLRSYAEYARSAYDYDAAGAAPRVSDDAHNILLQYLPAPRGAFEWNASLQWQRVGSNFRSLANAALPNDKSVLSTSVQAVFEGYSASLQLAEERDNVNGVNTLPTVATQLWQLDLGYSAQQFSQQETDALARLFANAVLQLRYVEADNRQVRAPASFQGDVTDNASRDLLLSAAFTPGEWNWSLAWQSNRFDDASGVQSASRSELGSFSLGLPLGEGVFVAPTVQAGQVRDLGSNVAQDELTTSVSINLALERLSGSLQYAQSRYDSVDVNYQSRSSSLGVMLNYRLLAPRAWRPALDLYINASWGEQGSALSGTLPATRQVYLGLRTALEGGS